MRGSVLQLKKQRFEEKPFRDNTEVTTLEFLRTMYKPANRPTIVLSPSCTICRRSLNKTKIELDRRLTMYMQYGSY